MEITAYMNNGRWILDCPVCSTPLPCRPAGVVCPRCYPNMLAKAYRRLPNGDLRPVVDQELVAKAQADARKADAIYHGVFPAEREQIERILRLRPAPKHMNWISTETLEDLRAQNLEHGDPLPEEE